MKDYSQELTEIRENLRAQIINFFDSDPKTTEIDIELIEGCSATFIGEKALIVTRFTREGAFDEEDLVLPLNEINVDDLSLMVGVINDFIEG